jgi:hypothetical protein
LQLRPRRLRGRTCPSGIKKWGKWKLDRDRRAIHYDGPDDYWFSLGQMNNSAEVLDWIVQLHDEKGCHTGRHRELWWRLSTTSSILQNNICGFGIEHRFNAQEHVGKLFPAASDASPGQLTGKRAWRRFCRYFQNAICIEATWPSSASHWERTTAWLRLAPAQVRLQIGVPTVILG